MRKRALGRGVGPTLLQTVGTPKNLLDAVFSTLFASMAGTWVAANLLYRDAQVAWHSGLVTVTCLGVLLFMYTAARTLNSMLWGVALGYLLLWGLAYTHPDWLVLAFRLVGLGAALYVIKNLRPTEWPLARLLFLASLTTLVMFSAQRYTTFNLVQRLSVGAIEQDTLFHASIAAMIKSYGVASTGLEGLVPVTYYTLSHALFAGLSVLSSVSVLDTYGIASWVLFGPLLVAAVVWCAIAIGRVVHVDDVGWLWGAACMLLVLVPAVLKPAVGFSNSFFVSESDLVAMGLFVLAMPMLFKERLSAPDMLLIALSAVLMTASKATVGIVYVGLWGARFVFIGQVGRWRSLWLTVLVCTAVVVTVLSTSAGSAGAVSFGPFDYLRYTGIGRALGPWVSSWRQQAVMTGYSMGSLVTWGFLFSALGMVVLFYVGHFLLSWVVIGTVWKKNGLKSLAADPVVVYVAASALAGMAVVAGLKIPSGSAYYVTNVAFFVALPVFLISLPGGLGALELSSWRRGACALGVLLAVAWMVVWMGFRPQWVREVRAATPLIDDLQALRQSAVGRRVYALNPEATPPGPDLPCTAQPFLYPAVSERVWRNVIREDASCHYVHYGYTQYGIMNGHRPSRIHSAVPHDFSDTVWPEEKTDADPS